MTMRVADLTVDELQDLLRAVLREMVEEIVEEKLGLLSDPDAGLAMKAEFAASLDDYLASDRRGDDADDVFRTLGIE